MSERHKQMCGCETCIVARGLLWALKAYQIRTSQKLANDANVMPDGPDKDDAVNAADDYKQFVCLPTRETMPPTMQDAIKLVQCPNVEGFSHPHWSCVLRTCKLHPKYNSSIPEHEKQTDRNDTTTSFDVYISYTKCLKHGLLETNAKTCPECEAVTGLLEAFKRGKI